MTSPTLPEPNPPEEGALQRWLDLYEHAPVGLCEVNTAGVIVAINQTLLGWLGWQREHVLDRVRVEACVTEDGVSTVQSLSERCRREGRVEGVILVFRTANSRRRFVGEVTAAAAYNVQGAFMGWRGSVREVTQGQARLQRQLQERTLEAVERLASGIAHKFNNLLQVIQGYSELGLITLESTHPVHGHLARIKEAAQRAAALVQGLVAFSRRQAVRRRPLDVNVFLEQLVGRLRRVVPAGIELQVMPAGERVRVVADAASLEQVIFHLVVNACEAMPEGGRVALETRLVRVMDTDGLPPAALTPGTYVSLSVSDTGVGIAPGVVAQIFEPFFTTKDTGSGLGLAVVWGVVKQHGGHVEVASQPGEGTTVRIYLPSEELATS
jgi:two-component system, cell cycle sensor histidine kinase and response regulator CckA